MAKSMRDREFDRQRDELWRRGYYLTTKEGKMPWVLLKKVGELTYQGLDGVEAQKEALATIRGDGLPGEAVT